MKLAVEIVGTSPYSPSKALLHEKPEANESHQTHNERVWKEHCHTNTKGEVTMPIFGLKAMLDGVAKYLGMKVEGGGKRTYSKIIQSGVIFHGGNPVLMVDGKPVNVKEMTIEDYGEWVYCHSDGKRDGKAGRVSRLFPNFDKWSCKFEVEAIDPRITERVLTQHLVAAGRFNGIGRFRPQNGGTLGRFEVLVNGKRVEGNDVVPVDDE